MRTAAVERARFLLLAGIIALQTVLVVQLADVQEEQAAVFAQQEAARDRELARELRLRNRAERLRFRVVRQTLLEAVREMTISNRREQRLLRRIREAFRTRAPERGADSPSSGGPASGSSTRGSASGSSSSGSGGGGASSPTCVPAGKSDQCLPEQAHGKPTKGGDG